MTYSFPKPKRAPVVSPKHPLPPTANNQSPKKHKNFAASKNTELYVSNVSFRFPANVNDSNIRDKAATLFAMMQRIDPSLALLPMIKDTDSEAVKAKKKDLPVILSGPSFPTETNLLRSYMSIPHFESRSAKVHAHLQSSKTIADIKKNSFIFSHLRKSGIWIDYNEIKSHDITQVGWFDNHHPEHYSRYYMVDEVKKVLPTNLHEHLQVNIRQVQYYASAPDSTEKQKIYTRAFVLEMDRAISREHSDTIFATFNNHKELSLIPMNSSFDYEGVFKQFFYNQNAMLKNTSSLRVDNLHGLDATIMDKQTGEKTTVRKLFSQNIENRKNPFLNIHQYNSNRVNFLVNKQDETWANEIISQFIYDYIPHHLTEETKKLITVEGKSPRIVGTRKVPTQIAVFVTTAKKKMQQNKKIIDIDSDSDTSELTSPPRTIRRSYAAAVTQQQTPQQPATSTTTSNINDNISTASSVQINRLDALLANVKSKNKTLSDNQSVISADVSQLSSKVGTMLTEFTEVQATLEKAQTTLQEQHTTIQQLQSSIHQHGTTTQQNQATLQQHGTALANIQQTLQLLATNANIELPDARMEDLNSFSTPASQQ